MRVFNQLRLKYPTMRSISEEEVKCSRYKPKSFKNIDFDKLLTLDGGILYKTTNWILKEIEKVQSIQKNHK